MHTTTQDTNPGSTSKWHQRLVETVQKRPIRSVLLAGAAVGIAISSYQKRLKQQKEDDDDRQAKKVLVLPFYKMKIVEESKANSLRSLLSSKADNSVEMSIDQVVDLIHQAAADPQIVGLYGVMGHGNGFSTGGWAHVEELRNALLVFQQSHRRHLEPGQAVEQASPKPMYLYSNTFSSPTPSGAADMKEYYLASAFTHVHLQPQGDLNLFGLHATNTFYRDFLAKYGITVHVWKHGRYKNFANQFTHSSYNQAHAENVSRVLVGIHQHICAGMFNARYERLKDYQYSTFWRMVHQAGSIPANMAQRIGFVDYLPPLNPLDDLIAYQKNEKPEDKEKLEAKWTQVSPESEGPLTDLQQFSGTKPISIMEYARKTKQKEKEKEREWHVFDRLKKLPSGVQTMLGLFGLAAPSYNFDQTKFLEAEAKGRDEQIAIVKINGPITDATARKLEGPLRKLKKAEKVKAVVVRVDSPGGAITACETIHQHLADLPQKVVVSFGNVSASGGYYISSNSDRIFASPTTITGSIGVVMLRADLRGLAHQWGIHFDSIPTSELSGSFDPFFPVNGRMKDNFANFADRAYAHFKRLVSEGRGLKMDQVEAVAQGRVWTGQQAKEIELVDELGGLHRAIAYCQRTFTESGHAQVVAWPPKKSLYEALMNRDEEDSLDNVEVPGVVEWIVEQYGSLLGLHKMVLESKSDASSGSMLASLESLLRQGRLPMAMSGMMLTLDENAAIRCLLEDNHVLDVQSSLPPGFYESF